MSQDIEDARTYESAGLRRPGRISATVPGRARAAPRARASAARAGEPVVECWPGAGDLIALDGEPLAERGVGFERVEDAPIGRGSLFGKNATLTGGPAPVRAYIDDVLPDVLSGAINPGLVFDRTVPLDDVADAYRAMDDRTALKVVVLP